MRTTELELATLGGGCFWCLEASFEQLQGVESVVSGYAGGDPRQADYESVCTGRTAHAEVIQVRFDPTVITFRQLLELFFAVHDPTTLNRQGNDIGPQYRSVIFTHSGEQEAQARETIAGLAFPVPVVTAVVPLPEFFPAEEYHQGYYRGNPRQPYCLAVVGPKAAKTRQKFAAWLKPVV
ncbi:MAG: peptide-methionine (S)-S-oxide reductase MsrA [Gemmataceae bacterium]